MPVYEDVEASSQLFKELFANFGNDIFVVAVDDGSVKQPLKIENMSKAQVKGAVLKLRRNVGHHIGRQTGRIFDGPNVGCNAILRHP